MMVTSITHFEKRKVVFKPTNYKHRFPDGKLVRDVRKCYLLFEGGKISLGEAPEDYVLDSQGKMQIVLIKP